jgi:hypothetical protein
MVLAMPIWHPEHVTKEEAMTELLAALAETTPTADEQRAHRVAAAFYETWKATRDKWGWQADLVRETGLSRETIRRHIEDERIRRGEIDPTPRYLREQQRKTKRGS